MHGGFGGGGGGFGHVSAGHSGTGHQSGHHHMGGEPDTVSNWSQSMQAERDANGNWKMKRKFVFNFATFLWCFFGGLLLWLFVIYGFSHPGSKSNLADLHNFPTAKYQNTIRAASMSTPWQRDALQPLPDGPVGAGATMNGPAPRSMRVASAPIAPRMGQMAAPMGSATPGFDSGSTFPRRNAMAQSMNQMPGSGFNQPMAPTSFARSLPSEDLLNAQPGTDGFNSAFGNARPDFFNADSKFVSPSAVANQAVLEGQNYVDQSQAQAADSAKSLIQAFSMSQASSGRLGGLVSAFASDTPTLGPDTEAANRLDLSSLGQVTTRPGNSVQSSYTSGNSSVGSSGGSSGGSSISSASQSAALAANAAGAFANNNPWAHNTVQSTGGVARNRVVVSR